MKFLCHGLILILIFVLLGCNPSSIRKYPQTPYSSLSDWPDFYRRNHQRLRTLQSEARISLETPSFAANFTMSLIFASPDTLFLQAEGPLGLDLGKIFIAKERFIIFNQFQNQFLSGSLEDDFYSTFLETSLSLHQVKTGLLGYVSLSSGIKLSDFQQGIFSDSSETGKYVYHVDAATGKLLKLEIFRAGQAVFTQEFKNYTLIEGILIPRLTRMILPQKKEMIAIYHKNIKINEQIDRSRYFIEISPKTKQLMINR